MAVYRTEEELRNAGIWTENLGQLIRGTSRYITSHNLKTSEGIEFEYIRHGANAKSVVEAKTTTGIELVAAGYPECICIFSREEKGEDKDSLTPAEIALGCKLKLA